jgi:chemotaxis protein MotB
VSDPIFPQGTAPLTPGVQGAGSGGRRAPPGTVAGQPRARRTTHAGSFARWHLESVKEPDEEGWLLTYLDVITLLLVMMVVMLAFSKPKGEVGKQADNTQPKVEIRLPVPLPEGEAVGSAPPPRQVQTDPLEGLPLEQLGPGIEVVSSQGGISFRISSEILFAAGDAQLAPQAGEVIDRLLPVFNKAMTYSIVVEGHTDNVPISTPRFPSNWELAAGRAGAVVRHLQTRGINPTRLSASGYAETRPVASNASPEGRATNRRVELVMRPPVAAARP